MAYFSCGDYIICNHINSYRISWEHNSIRHHLDLNLDRFISDYIELHTKAIINLINLFETDYISFQSNKSAIQLIGTLSIDETVPTQQLSDFDLKLWYRKQILTAYNRIHSTNFTTDMLNA